MCSTFFVSIKLILIFSEEKDHQKDESIQSSMIDCGEDVSFIVAWATG